MKLALANSAPPPFNHPVKSKRRLFTLLALGGLLVVCAGAFLYFQQSRPIGSGPAGPTVPPINFASQYTNRQIWLIGIGDSVTAGFGARKGYSYFDLLVTNSPDDFPEMHGLCLSKVAPGLHFTNLSVSGSTSQEHAEKQIPHLPVINSNALAIIVMTSGGNDLIHNYGRTPPRDQAMYGATFEEAQPWIASFEKRLDDTFENMKAHFPGGCEIFIADIFDPTDGVGDIQRTGLPAWPDGMKILTAYNDVIYRCAEKRIYVHVVPMHNLFLGHGIHCSQFWRSHYDAHDPHYWYYVNLEDPNERGYDAIRRLFLMKIGKILYQES